ncbi:NAD(P)/FAD-dependent oxidoreductase [Rhodococcus indonesiensis]
MRHVLVVGASLAGVRVAENLRSRGFDGHLSLIGAEQHLPYDRPPLSKELLTGSLDPDAVVFHERAWFADHDIDLRLGERAVHLDPQRRTLQTTEGTLEYDELVVATGARARNPFPQAPRGVCTLRTLDDAEAFRAALTAAAHLVVIGGGFIGLEVASSARALGKDVTVVEVADTPLVRSLGVETAPAVADLARNHGIRLLCGRSVTALGGTGSVESVRLDNGEDIDCDLVLLGVGAVPNTEWLDGAGLELTSAGIVCDPTGRAGEHLWAAGDVCSWRDTVGVAHRHEHWTSAAEQATLVAHNLLGDDSRTLTSAPYVWSDQFGRRINLIGTTTGYDAVRVLGHDVSDLVALYARDGLLVGACVVDQASLMLKCRRWVAERTPVTAIPAWDLARV